jgi:hypothetical protein
MEIAGCGNYTIEAVTSWLNVGGRRLDAADSYASFDASGPPERTPKKNKP